MVRLSWICALLDDSDTEYVVFDNNVSVLEGSAVAIQRRIMVLDEEWPRARRMLEDAGEI